LTKHLFLQEEISAVNCLVAAASGRADVDHIKILPTALLIFRVLSNVATGSLTWNEISTMQAHDVSNEVAEHRMAVE